MVLSQVSKIHQKSENQLLRMIFLFCFLLLYWNKYHFFISSPHHPYALTSSIWYRNVYVSNINEGEKIIEIDKAINQWCSRIEKKYYVESGLEIKLSNKLNILCVNFSSRFFFCLFTRALVCVRILFYYDKKYRTYELLAFARMCFYNRK